MTDLQTGTRIYYRGDMANIEDFGTITKSYADKWGDFYDITLDDGRTFKGIFKIMVHDIDSGNGSTRFVTLEAYEKRQNEQIEAFIKAATR